MGGREVTLRTQGTDAEGLVAIVTGGASGIGAAIADRLHADGVTVAVLDRDTTHADERFAAFTADVSDRASVDAAVAAVAERFGRIDIVVNNAGVGAQGDIAANDDDEWARVLSINVTGIARVTSAALPWLRKSPPPPYATRPRSPRPPGSRSGRCTPRRRGRVGADSRDGRRSSARGHPRQCGQSRHGGHAVGRTTARLRGRPRRRAGRVGGTTAPRTTREPRRGRRRGGLPRESRRGLHHGHLHRGRRGWRSSASAPSDSILPTARCLPARPRAVPVRPTPSRPSRDQFRSLLPPRTPLSDPAHGTLPARPARSGSEPPLHSPVRPFLIPHTGTRAGEIRIAPRPAAADRFPSRTPRGAQEGRP